MNQLRIDVSPGDHRRGPKSASVALVEYGDYECPYCGAAYFELERLREILGDELLQVYRHFPLGEAHPHALQAAEAAEAAGAQRRFWPMHDILFQNQHALDEEWLLAYADSLGLDVERFARDLNEHRFLPKVRADFMGGVRSGVNGTPNIFLNGTRYSGPYSTEALLETIRGGLEATP